MLVPHFEMPAEARRSEKLLICSALRVYCPEGAGSAGACGGSAGAPAAPSPAAGGVCADWPSAAPVLPRQRVPSARAPDCPTAYADKRECPRARCRASCRHRSSWCPARSCADRGGNRSRVRRSISGPISPSAHRNRQTLHVTRSARRRHPIDWGRLCSARPFRRNDRQDRAWLQPRPLPDRPSAAMLQWAPQQLGLPLPPRRRSPPRQSHNLVFPASLREKFLPP